MAFPASALRSVLTSKIPKISRRRVAIANVRNTFRALQTLDHARITANKKFDIGVNLQP